MNDLPKILSAAISAKRRVWAPWISFVFVLPLVVLSAGPPYVYVLDLAMVAFWWIWCPMILVLLILVIYSRSRVVVVFLVIALFCSSPLIASRALWVPRDPGSHESTDVTVVVFNSDLNNQTRGQVGPFVYGLDADVLVVIEPVWEFYRDTQRKNLIHPSYPNIVERTREEGVSHFLVFSKWKISQFEDESLDNADGIVCIIHRPDDLGGAFLVVATHLPSPRNLERWTRGYDSTRRIAKRIKILVDSGYQVVFAADLNSAPGCARDRILRSSAKIQRGKPLLGAWGSYPASWSIGRIAIDDIWVSTGIRVKSWETISGPGSDHLAVRATLNIPTETAKP